MADWAPTSSSTSDGPALSETLTCRFCGGESMPALRAWDRNRELSDEQFSYRRCFACGTFFLAAVPADLPSYYEGGYYDFDADGEPLWRTDPFRQRVEAERIELLSRYVQSGSLIEIGSGAGGFAAAAKQAGFDVTAIEMDAHCCEVLTERLGVTAICTDQPVEAMAELPKADVVAMWHVLEHLSDPGAALAVAAGRLEPGGILLIGVPNPESLQFRLGGPRWAHLDAPRHLSLIPAGALVDRGRVLGLQPVHVTTADLFGRHCNAHGWSTVLAPRPARGIPRPAQYASGALTRMLAPVEGRALRGSALRIVLRKG